MKKTENDLVKKSISNNSQRTMVVVVFLATLIGAFIRLFYVLQSDFPLNDGGMFYTMIKDLQAANYHLPAFTSYNQAAIPFAYPPLPFYLGGVLNSWFGIDLIQLLRFLPLVFSVLSIPAFYWLAKMVLKTDVQRGAAVFIFALFSPVYTWQIMGGGLTRSPAFFFMILAFGACLSWVKQHKWSAFIWMIIFTALTTLCHLEMLWMLAISFLVIFFVSQRTWKGFGQFLLAAVAVLLLTSPWWGTVIALHGLSPFIQAMNNGAFNILRVFASLFFLTSTQDLNQILFQLLALVGVFLAFRERNWLLPAWWLALVLFDPRSSQRSVAVPVALLAGLVLDQWLEWVSTHLPWRKRVNISLLDQPVDFSNGWIKLILTVLLFSFMLNDTIGFYTSGSLLSNLNKENRAAMQWVKQNTSSESQFLVIDFPGGWYDDRVGEWFPTLSERISILTAQGQEWLPENKQLKTVTALGEVSACQLNGLDCLTAWINKNQVQVNYFYFTLNTQQSGKPLKYTSVIEAQMANDSAYQLAYSNSDVKIYKKK